MAAIDSGLVTRQDVLNALKKRIAPTSKTIPDKILFLLNGRYSPISYGPEGLKGRREKIVRRNPDLDKTRYNTQYFLPFGLLEREKNKWRGLRFEDFERRTREPEIRENINVPQIDPVSQITEPVTPPVQDTGTPTVAPTPVANVNPMTGLTTTETALLSPGEQAIRQKQRTTGIA